MKQLGKILSLVMAATMILAGCGSQPGGTNPAGGAPADSGKPQQGGVLMRAVNYGDPGTLDPIAKGDVSARMVTMQIFSNLVRYDAVQKKIVKDVAEDYSVSSDGLTYNFKLKKGVLFHNGQELKASDVKYTIERMTNPKNASVATTLFDSVVGAREYREGKATEIQGVTVKGDYEIEFKLHTVKPLFLLDLASGAAGIVPRAEADKLGPDFGQKPVGSGPFKFADWKKDDKIELAVHDKYHAGRAYLDGVVFRFMREEQTRDAEFLAGTIDVQVLGEVLYKKYAADPERKKALVEVPELFTRAMFMRVDKAPFTNVKVRQAINHAIDKQAIIEKVLSNKAFIATGILPNSANAFNKDLKGYEYDPDKAKQLLKEANMEKVEFEVLVSAGQAKWVEAFNTYWNKVGINAKIVQLELGTVLARAREGDYQAVFYSTGGDSDSLPFLYNRFHSKNHGSSGNITLYKNDQVDRLLDEAASSLDEAKRLKLLQDAEKLIVADAPWFMFNYNKAVMIAQPWVHGLQPVPTDVDFQDLTKVWLSKKQ